MYNFMYRQQVNVHRLDLRRIYTRRRDAVILKVGVCSVSMLGIYITEHAAIQICKTMIIPYLDYGDIIYHNLSNKLISKLPSLQDRALKICFKPRIATPALI